MLPLETSMSVHQLSFRQDALLHSIIMSSSVKLFTSCDSNLAVFFAACPMTMFMKLKDVFGAVCSHSRPFNSFRVTWADASLVLSSTEIDDFPIKAGLNHSISLSQSWDFSESLGALNRSILCSQRHVLAFDSKTTCFSNRLYGNVVIDATVASV